KLLMGEVVWDLDKVEFHPSQDAFPLAYWRSNMLFSLPKSIPEEIVLFAEGKANKYMSDFASRSGFTPLKEALLKKGVVGYKVSDTVRTPFALKALKSVHEAFDKNRLGTKPTKLPVLKESKLGVSLILCDNPEYSEFKDFESFAQADKLRANAPSAQLGEHFPDLPASLIHEEFVRRSALIQQLSTMAFVEIAGSTSEDTQSWSYVAKMMFPALHAAFFDYYRVKRTCRSFPLKGVSMPSDMDTLVSVEVFSKDLYSASTVADIQAACRNQGKSLRARWGLEASTSASSSRNQQQNRRRVRRVQAGYGPLGFGGSPLDQPGQSGVRHERGAGKARGYTRASSQRGAARGAGRGNRGRGENQPRGATAGRGRAGGNFGRAGAGRARH
ncbi:MAG: hypothetical protein AAGM46_26295, partial [Cyanobacteria bacterium J06582_2]